MRNKTFLLVIAGVCGTIAAVGANQWMQAQGTGGKKTQTVEIFVAVKDIDVSEEITAENIKLEEWPADRVPEGALNKLEALEGKYANQRLFAGEPLMQRKLMDSASNTGLKIPKGFSVVSMAADAASGVANLVRPGDRVNVIGFFQKSDVIPQTMTQTVLSGVRVFAVDGRTVRNEEEEGGKAARTISLLIHKKDEEAWTYASELGKVRLTLGRPDEDGDTAGPNEAGQQFLQWLADYQKARDARQAQTLVSQPPAAEPAEQAEAPAAVVAAEPDAPQFQMLKMGANGQLSVFEFSPGGVPIVVQSTGDSGAAPETPAPVESTAPAPGQPQNEYSYLNGSLSPLFEGGADGTKQGDGDATAPGAGGQPAGNGPADGAAWRETF